jgi:electron transfer flavoprotein beta subunit
VNPDDLSALEVALRIREQGGGSVRVVTMGPPSAAEVIREALYRGADGGILLTDKKFAASDTLATSYALSLAVQKMGPYDLVLCGQQALDGNTAQVGPQVAEKLNLPQITFVEKILSLSDGLLTVRRGVDDGEETWQSRLPALLTVLGSAAEPRPASAKSVMRFKRLLARSEKGGTLQGAERPGGRAGPSPLKEWDADELGADPERCGLAGSPTWVRKIESVVLAPRELEWIPSDEGGMGHLLQLLRNDHIIE